MTQSSSIRRQGPQRSIENYAREAYREAILEAAERLFTRVGYHETKMADLAADAGVAVGTLYKHFRSKEEVFASLSARNREQLVSILDEARQVDDPIQQLIAIVTQVFAYVEDRAALFAIYAELGDSFGSQAPGRGEGSNCRACDRLFGVLESIFEDAMEAGQIRNDLAASLLAATFAGAMNSALLAWVRADRKYALTEHSLPLVDLFLKGARKS